VLDPQTTDLWFAGKKLERGKLMQDYLGKNEKTKAVVKLQEAGGLKPSREPASCSSNQISCMVYNPMLVQLGPSVTISFH
jgi:hypothetical protein